DIFIPVRKDSTGTKIEVLASPAWQHMDDIEYFLNKLFAAIKVPKAYMGQEQGVGRAVLCLTGDTRVPLLDGRTRTMRELAEEYGTSETFYVYSCDEEGRVAVGEARGCRVTRPHAEVWEVELDDGSTIRGTPDHPFLMRSGVYRNLSELKPGDSLMP